MLNLIKLRQVSKTFRKGFSESTVLQNIDLTIHKGEFVVLRGENGAGKSTLLNLILGLIKPSQGEVKLMGLSPQDSASKLCVGVVLQETTIPKNIKVKELVQLMQSYYPQKCSVEDVLRKVKLEDKSEAWASSLSGGQKQRLYFALALVGNPELLILDEPTRNLDDKGYKEFWEQITACYQQGITILMVTNNNSDWEKLNYLATRYINLHTITNSPVGGQLSEEINQTNSNQISTQKHQNKTLERISYNSSNYISKIFREQIWSEILQLLRTPAFLVGIALFASFVSFLPFRGENAKEALASFSVLILLTICIDRLGKRISVERAEGWLKLLRATPLPPGIYIAAKVFTTLLLSAVTLILIMILGVWRLEIEANLQHLSLLFIGLIVGAIPFAVLGLALSYLTEPKSYDSIAGLSIPIGLATCGALKLTKPSFFPDIVLFSPFYHYRELTLWAAGIDYDKHLLFHLLWLIWAGCVFGLLAIWAYQRDSITE